MRRLIPLVLALSVFALGGVECPAADVADRLFWGGGIGFGFGDVDFVDISPMIGLHLTEQVSAGVQLTYRYLDDGRYSPSISTSDYGGALFGEYSFKGLPVFLHAEYEHLSYEYQRVDGGTDRSSLDSLLAGGGYVQQLGPKAALSITVLYNFSYDDSDLSQPYDEPWVLRAGFAFGF